MHESVVPAPWLIPVLPVVAVSFTVLMFVLLGLVFWHQVSAADQSRFRRWLRWNWDAPARWDLQAEWSWDVLIWRWRLQRVRAWLRDNWDIWAVTRRGSWGGPLVLAVLLGAGTGYAQEEPQYLALYAGRLLTVDIDGSGALTQGQDLYVARMVVAVPGPAGLRFGFRGDLTALSAIDPTSLDPSAVRTAEGYAALSWSAKAKGWSFGPAGFAGALVPVEDAVDWRMKSAYGAGVRVGFGASWAYAFVGKDAASDEVAGNGTSPMRLVVPFNVQWKFLAGQGEVVTGPGGRLRLAVVVQVPNPWSE